MDDEVRSYVRGRAEAVFGGAIKVSIGYDKATESGAIMLSEIEKNIGIGAEIGDTKSYDPQVVLVFNDIRSIDVMRDALDNLEYAFKYKHLPVPLSTDHTDGKN